MCVSEATVVDFLLADMAIIIIALIFLARLLACVRTNVHLLSPYIEDEGHRVCIFLSFLNFIFQRNIQN